MTHSERRKERRFRRHRREYAAITDRAVFRVKIHHDGTAYITEDTPPGRYRRFTVVEIRAADAFAAIDKARDIV
jgi:hypothetical protein